MPLKTPFKLETVNDTHDHDHLDHINSCSWVMCCVFVRCWYSVGYGVLCDVLFIKKIMCHFAVTKTILRWKSCHLEPKTETFFAVFPEKNAISEPLFSSKLCKNRVFFVHLSLEVLREPINTKTVKREECLQPLPNPTLTPHSTPPWPHSFPPQLGRENLV